MKLPMFDVLLSLIALVAAAPREKPDLNSVTPFPASNVTLFANPLAARQGLETQLTKCTNSAPNECGRVIMENGVKFILPTGCHYLLDRGNGVASFEVYNCYCTFWT
jgi:hypothetical protein